MDVRELERRWRLEPENEELFDELLRQYQRLNLELPVEILAHTKRWRLLSKLVANFYEDPLDEKSGHSSEEIEAKEAELGISFSESLREWFRLVGRRLRGDFDCPMRLDSSDFMILEKRLFSEERTSKPQRKAGIPIWLSGRNDWIAVTPGAEQNLPDPCVEFFAVDDSVARECVNPPLSQFLIGMALYGTMNEAGFGRATATFGSLKHSVYGGSDGKIWHEFCQNYERCFDCYWKLPRQDEFDLYMGDDCILLMTFDAILLWACTSAEGLERLRKEAGIRESPESILRLQFSELSEPDIELLRRKIEDPQSVMVLGHSEQSGTLEGLMWSDSSRSEPKKRFARIKAEMEQDAPDLLNKLEAAWRPENRGDWNILWPPGLDRFVT